MTLSFMKIGLNMLNMNKIFKAIILVCLILSFGACSENTNTIWLDDLNMPEFSEGISSVTVIRPESEDTISMANATFTRGIGVRYIGVIPFYLDGNARQFTAEVGTANTSADANPVKFYVIGDRKILFESDETRAGDGPQKVDVDLDGIKRLGLLLVNIGDQGKRGLACWANAKFVMIGDHVPQPIPNTDDKYILTPPSSKAPKINSSLVFGATPGNPFLYTVAATGARPLKFSAENLPKRLSIDSKTGIISGKMYKRGTYQIMLKASNEFGEATNKLKIIIGDTIALTPPMGWNGWNSWARNIDRDKVVSSANTMVNSGLINHGWTSINIDDTWEGQRGGKYNAIQPNEKFPDFPGMVEYIHSIGLKVGLYSTPWISTYAGYTGCSSDFENGYFPDSIRNNKRAYRYVGKYTFETNDADQMAAWGIDYLKYDWHLTVPPAERMMKALRKSGRDMVYSLSNSAPFEQASEWSAIANLWRTGGDIRDSWISLYISAFTIDKWAPFAGPGHWNDPDMLVLGNISTGSHLHPTRLTPDEQYSHMSIYCLLASPLIIGCPIEQLDPFTNSLLTNDEVIAVDQDPLGKPGRLMVDENGIQIWVKSLADGSYAVGLFNTDDFGKTPQSYFRWGDETSKDLVFHLSKIGLSGPWRIRDLWRQKDLGNFENVFKTSIPFHGVVMIRMFPIDNEDKNISK